MCTPPRLGIPCIMKFHFQNITCLQISCYCSHSMQRRSWIKTYLCSSHPTVGTGNGCRYLLWEQEFGVLIFVWKGYRDSLRIFIFSVIRGWVLIVFFQPTGINPSCSHSIQNGMKFILSMYSVGLNVCEWV